MLSLSKDSACARGRLRLAARTPGRRHGRCTCCSGGPGVAGRSSVHDCPRTLQSLPCEQPGRPAPQSPRAQAVRTDQTGRPARLLLPRPRHANRRASCRASLHGRLRRGRVSPLSAGRHPVLELRRHAPPVDGRPRDVERRGPRAPARDARAAAARRRPEPVPRAASVGHALAVAPAARGLLTTPARRGSARGERSHGAHRRHTRTSHSAPSSASRRVFASVPPRYCPTPPPDGSTRWHGTTIGSGLVESALPVARNAAGLPARAAISR